MSLALSIILPTYNRPKRLRQCLSAIAIAAKSCPDVSYELIIVDDGSKQDLHLDQVPNARLIRQNNKGPGAARNAGIKLAQGNIIAFLDDDCFPTKDWLLTIYKTFQEDPRILILQGSIAHLSGNDPFYRTSAVVTQIADKVRVVSAEGNHPKALFIGSGNFAIRKSVILEHDLFFDESLRAREDEDLYRRIERLNIPIYYKNNPVIHVCSCGFLEDYKRYYGYGMAEFGFRKKWGNKLRLRYDISLKNLIHLQGPIWGFLIWNIIRYRSWASHKGLQAAEKAII